MFQLLRRHGAIFVDTEFAEQHKSLWLVKFFPSLAARYDRRIFSVNQYRAWLKDSGFSAIEFDHAMLGDEEEDAALRIGQHKPQLYLDEAVLRGIPAFHEMSGHERLKGKKQLHKAILTRQIDDIIADYEKAATMDGDVGFIVARR